MNDKLRQGTLILLGNAMLAMAVALFVIHNGFISGGATGFSLILRHYFGGDIALIVLAINVFTFAIGTVLLGKHFAMATVISSLSYPLFLKLFQLSGLGERIQLPLIIEAACAAMLIGSSLVLILRQGASTGGLDVFALILEKYRGVSITVTVNAVDLVVLLGQMAFAQTSQIAFGLCIVLITTVTMKTAETIGSRRQRAAQTAA